MNISKEKMEMLNSFSWRFYNTFKSAILPIALPMILVALQNTPNDFSVLRTKELWISVAYAIVISALTGIIAGLDKVKRSK